jgi:anti-sigma B factor antagonist
MGLRISTREQSGVVVVDCAGRIVFGDEAIQLRETVKGLLERPRPVVINMKDVSYLDSGGLGTLVGLFTSAQRDGSTIKLAALNGRVIDLLQITKLVTVFELYDSVEAAIASFAGSGAARGVA